MDAVVGRAERRLVGSVAAHRMVGDDLAGVPAPDDQRRGDDGHGLDLLAEPEPPQLARAVGRQRDGGADLAQLVRLLVELAADPALAQREREDQPADPAADDRDLEVDIALCDRRRARRRQREVVGERVAAVARSTPGCTISSGLTALATSLSR